MPDIDGRAQMQAVKILGLIFYNVSIYKKNPLPPFNHANLDKYRGVLPYVFFPTSRVQVFILIKGKRQNIFRGNIMFYDFLASVNFNVGRGVYAVLFWRHSSNV